MKVLDIVTIIVLVVVAFVVLFIFIYYRNHVSNYKPFANVWNKNNKKGIPYSQVIKDMMTTIFTKLKAFPNAPNVSNRSCLENTHNIEIIPMWGTLLGLERHGSIIEWDDDVDVFVEKKQWDLIRNNRNLFKDLFESDGIMVTAPLLNNTLMKFYYKDEKMIRSSPSRPQGVGWSWPFIDLFYYEIKGDKLTTPFFSYSYTFDKSSFFPLHRRVIDGVSYNMPNDPTKILDISYKGWKETCISSNYNHRLEKPIFNWNIYKMPTEQLGYKLDSVFDNVYVINLKRRPDRLDGTINELKKIDITKVNVWDATDAQSNEFERFYGDIASPKMSKGEMACYISHLNLWKKLASTNTEFAIIFEDDVSIPSSLTKSSVMKYIEKSRGFNILFLGHCYSDKFTTPKVKPSSALCLHAYVISLSGVRALLKLPFEKNIPVDHVVKKLCIDNLCFITNSQTNGSLLNTDGGLIDQKLNVTSDIPQKTIIV